jgi:DNA helicase HerA-like ATPase
MTQAWSLDGSVFGYEVGLDAGLPLGGFVQLVTDDGAVRLGQVLSGKVAMRPGADGTLRRAVEGEGVLLGAQAGAFGHARIGPADAPLIQRRPRAAREGEAELAIGGLRDVADIPATLRAAGFNRHTFLCGQSGSGKTYALGLLLEQLMLRTRLPLLVLDPNGDYQHLARTRPEVDPSTSQAYQRAAQGTQVLSAAAEDGQALRIRFRDLGTDGQAAVLQLDPLRDREEYNELLHLVEAGGGWASYAEVLQALSGPGSGAGEALRMRLENLRIGAMAVWAGRDGRSVVDRWAEDRPRALVADLSGLAERRERVAVALAVLQGLWAGRTRREPCLLVVDEAHDLCPAAPADELQERVLDLFIRVAGEGRKYGLHLLLATQRPDKLHANVLSQCDNVVLLRVNSAADRAQLQEQFSFAPAGLVELAGRFRQGEALLAGPITPFPLLARFGQRLTPEGGSDVPTDWAR